MQDTFYYEYEDGFTLHAIKLTCRDCGRVCGLFQALCAGVCHINKALFTCLSCLQTLHDEGRISDEPPGENRFIETILAQS